MQNVYFIVGEFPPGFTVEQRQNAHKAVKSIGPQSTSHPNADGQPSNVMHSRTRSDEMETLYRGMFEDGEITRANIVSVVAAELGMQENAVNAVIDYTVLGPAPAGKLYVMADLVGWGDVIED